MDPFPESEGPSSRSQEAFAEFLSRRNTGEEFDFEDLCASYPELNEDLRRLCAHWRSISGVLELLSVSGSAAARIRRRFGTEADPEVSLETESNADPPSSDRLLQRLAEHQGGFVRYRIKGEVARGGMGAILRVWDTDLRRHLAMKVVLGRGEVKESGATPEVDPVTLGRFLEEAQVTGQLDHPGVVPVHELGLDAEGRVYFTMRLLKGCELREIIERVHAGDPEWTRTRALGVLLKVCETMAFAHDKGVIHRDLKPANVMVGRYGEVYVMDWGLARVEGQTDLHDIRPETAASVTLSEVRTERKDARGSDAESPLFTMDGTVMGTPFYMPLEQAAGKVEEVDARSDAYAVGAMLYHLLTGRMPYHRPGEKPSPHTVLAMVLQGPPEPVHAIRSDVPPELEAICAKAMAREPADRYADIGELADDLRAFLETRVVKAYRTGALIELSLWVRRNKALSASAALAALAVAVLFVLAWVEKNRADRNARVAVDLRDVAEESLSSALEGTEELRRRFDTLQMNNTALSSQLAQLSEGLTLGQVELSSVQKPDMLTSGSGPRARPASASRVERRVILSKDLVLQMGWSTLLDSEGSLERYVEVLDQLIIACGHDDDDGALLTALGAAYYRVGRFLEAEALLSELTSDGSTLGLRDRGLGLAFLAMASHRMGRVESARDALTDARSFLTSPDPDPVLREASALIESGVDE